MNRFCAVLLATLVAAGPASAAEAGRPVGGPVVFRPEAGTILEVAGKGAYRGSIEVRPTGQALTVVNDLDLESYLQGLAEVPGSWPMNALKAQAVAARTYALWEKENGAWRRDGFDVCATTLCQVYRGVAGERRETGNRWVEAVRATRGEVLLYRGKPALTRYHASSGGQTLGNEVVFPKQGRLPYLRGTRDPADQASPLYRWSVFFTRDQMAAIVREGLGVEGALEDVTADEEIRTVLVRTSEGERRLSTPRFRDAVSRTAPKLFPTVFPAARNDGKPMPLALPSSRFAISGGESGFTFAGRGFGHGVGMSQWGAKGRADRGDDYRAILAAYYDALTVSVWTGSISLRVGILRGTQSAGVSGSGPFAVSSGSDPLARSSIGRWSIARGSTRALNVRPPEGFSLPLVLSGLVVPRRIVVSSGELEAALRVAFVIPKSARVDAVVTDDGRRLGRARGVFEAGEGRLRVSIPDPGRLQPKGRYTLRLTAFDGDARVTRTTRLVIERRGLDQSLPVTVGTLLALLAAACIAWRRRTRSAPRSAALSPMLPAGPAER